MDEYPIKSVTFGGFDKQDVAQYIHRLSQEAAAAQKQLREENAALKERLAECQELSENLQQERQIRQELEQKILDLSSSESAAREELNALRPELEQLRQEAAAMRQDAQTYTQFRERLGGIECEALERAAALERTSAEQVRHMLEEFKSRYAELMRSFTVAAALVQEELKKVEVTVTRLPEAMEPASEELDALSATVQELTKSSRADP